MLSKGDKKTGPGPAPVADTVDGIGGGETKQSVVGTSLKVVGEIHSTGSVRIEGHVQGSVRARTLTVGNDGCIVGRAEAEIAQIDGTVDGEVHGAMVVLGATARVKGDIVQTSLSVDPGASFEGRVRSLGATKRPAKATAAAPPPSGAGQAKTKSATG